MAIHKARPRETTVRHLWLAGLGLVSLLRPGAVAPRAIPPMQARQWRHRVAADPSVTRAADGSARRRIRDAITLLDEGIGARLAPLLRTLALRPKATPGVERGGAAQGHAPGASAGGSRHVGRTAQAPETGATARPRQSR